MCTCIPTTSHVIIINQIHSPATMWRSATISLRRLRIGHRHGHVILSSPTPPPIPNPNSIFLSPFAARSLAGVAEAAIFSTDADESDDIRSALLHQLPNPNPNPVRAVPKPAYGAGAGRLFHLRRRQIKIETEAWEKAAREYKELLANMCERKLAPNLPYVKSLFLGWFEPLRDEIAKEQEMCSGDAKFKASHRPYFDRLPADMMAVITMNKLMSLLMMGTGGDGTVRVVQAACQIGEAIEQEVGFAFSCL